MKIVSHENSQLPASIYRYEASVRCVRDPFVLQTQGVSCIKDEVEASIKVDVTYSTDLVVVCTAVII